MREDPVLQPGQEHHGKLQTLGGVQGHQGHHALVLGIVGRYLVGVGDQGHLLQEPGQGRPLDLLVRGGGGVGGHPFAVLPGDADQLLQVLHPTGVLRVQALLQLAQVAGALQRRLQYLLRQSGRGQLPQPVQQRHELGDRVGRPGRDARRLGGPAQRRGERDALPAGQRLHARLGPVADPAPGGVEDPPQ